MSNKNTDLGRWRAGKLVAVGDIVRLDEGSCLRAIAVENDRRTGGSTPIVPEKLGGAVVDNDVTWELIDENLPEGFTAGVSHAGDPA